MDIAEIRSLFEFNDWANAATFEVLAALTHEQLTKDNSSSFPSVLLTAAHIVGAERLWLERLKGAYIVSVPDWVTQPDLNDLVSRLRQVQSERSAYFAAMSSKEAQAVVPFKMLSGAEGRQSIGAIVRHVVNHSTYHRGQIAAFVRQLGVKPPSTDYLLFARDHLSL